MPEPSLMFSSTFPSKVQISQGLGPLFPDRSSESSPKRRAICRSLTSGDPPVWGGREGEGAGDQSWRLRYDVTSYGIIMSYHVISSGLTNWFQSPSVQHECGNLCFWIWPNHGRLVTAGRPRHPQATAPTTRPAPSSHYSTLLYSTPLHSTPLHSTLLYSTLLYYAACAVEPLVERHVHLRQL